MWFFHNKPSDCGGLLSTLNGVRSLARDQNSSWRAAGHHPNRLDRSRKSGSLFSPDQHEELCQVQAELDFPETVYGVPRGRPLRTIVARQVEFYGAHRDDQVV